MARRFEWRPTDGAVAGVVLGAIIILLIFGGNDGSTSRPDAASTRTTTVERTTSTVETSTTAEPTTAPLVAETTILTTATTGSGPAGTDAFVSRLRVADEPPRVDYDRDLFRHWTTGANGCSIREQVLINESRTPAQVDPQGCTVRSGDWLSIYDGYSTPDPGELDIDHVVALGEAWDSGANSWDAGRREAFANDLAEPGALIAVTAATNRSKSDRDPSSWQPPNDGAWCQFATDWVNVKVKWDLTADAAEVNALRNMMRAGCEDGRPHPSTR